MSHVEMKDSGIDWVGQTPSHWKIRRLKNIIKSIGGGNYGEEENFLDLNLPCISISDFKHGDISNTVNIKMVRSYQNKFVIKKGTILIEKSGGGEKIPVGRIIFVKNNIASYFTNFVQGITTKQNALFLSYLLKTIHHNKIHLSFVKQNTGLQNFNFNGFAATTILAIPPMLEQQKIADFLDFHTSKIDKEIFLLEDLVSKLEEYLQSVIFETVTKGLDPSAEMKDSGIEWVGKIPSLWRTKRIKDVSSIKKGKATETFINQGKDMLPIIDTNFLRGRDNIVYTKSGLKVKPGQVLILWDGANAGELFINNTQGYLGSTFGVFETTLNNKFYFYYLKGIEQYSRNNVIGMGIPHVNSSILKQTMTLIPPTQEQQKIADFLDYESEKTNNKITSLNEKINLLKEYKQSLIYEAVTGKMEIK